MRRALVTVLAALLGLALLVTPAVAADGGLGSLLAVTGEPVGPEPMPRLADDNPARELAGYETPETPFTWGAAWILTFTGFVGLAILIGTYELRVRRPRREAASHS